MKISMNHVAVMADDARQLAAFYRDVVGLEPVVAPAAQHVNPDSYKWLKLGDHELHIVQRDDQLATRLGVNIDPIKAHFAFSVESMESREELIDRLTKAGVKWMDWSPHGIPGKYQLFFLDPGGNLIEFQVVGPKA
jgi:catechol 2,3-dioxygenase-like lactoylglutathione lyase family enzyme